MSSSFSCSPLTYHVVGDAYVDIFCFLEGDLPESGGDSRLEQPIKQYAGGSSTNTATHLHSLIQNFYHPTNKQAERNQQTAKTLEEEQEWYSPPNGVVTTMMQQQQQQQQPEQHQHQPNNHNKNDPNKPTVLLHTVYNNDDLFGKVLRKHGEKQGFEILNCYRPPPHQPKLSTGHCVAIVSDGERSFMTHQGCVGTFTANDLDLPCIINTPHDIHVHIAGYFNVEGFHNGNLQASLKQIRSQRATARMAATATATATASSQDDCSTTTVSLVTQHDASKKWDGGLEKVTPYLDFLIMNELEANSILKRQTGGRLGAGAIGSSISSLNMEDPNHAQAWLEYFSTWDPTTCVIVTLGAQGAVAFRNHKLVATLLPAITVTVVDPTGAGDSFTAGFLHGLWEWKRQTNHSNNAAKASMTTVVAVAVDGISFQKMCWPAEAIQYALVWGCAVGTSAVTIRGASNPAPPDIIQSYYQQQRTREMERSKKNM